MHRAACVRAHFVLSNVDYFGNMIPNQGFHVVFSFVVKAEEECLVLSSLASMLSKHCKLASLLENSF